MNSRFTVNVGLRFDRYRSFLPEQEGPSGGRFAAATATPYAEVSNVKTFNHPVPRIGIIYDVTGEGRTVVKANYAQYFWNPGTDIANVMNPNSQDYYKRYNWTDGSNLPAGTPGAATGSSTSARRSAPTRRSAASARRVLDPNLKNTRTDEVSAWIEHELVPGVGLQGGYVYRKIDNFRVRVNVNRPVSAYNVPVTLRDPGPDGVFGNGDDGANFQAFNLNPANLALPNVNQLTNLDGEGEYQTVEFGINKRQTGKWSLAASVSKRWNKDHATTYFGQNLRAVVDAVDARTTSSTPTTASSSSACGRPRSTAATSSPWQIRVTPALRFQSGQPYGRTILASAAYGIGGTGGINYGTQRILMEPLGTRTQDDIMIFDMRAGEVLQPAEQPPRGRVLRRLQPDQQRRPAEHHLELAARAFELPSSIVPPTIARFGMKFDW